jgi:type II secretory ATPase GspE/PulE/Tfp pilus assembly ATPase PilB-like protein
VKEQNPTGPANPKPPSETPAVRWVNQLLIRSVRERARGILIEPTREGLNVRFRTDSGLETEVTTQSEMQSEIAARIKAMFRIDIEKRQVPLNGNYLALVDGRRVDFRLSISPTTYGESMVMQVLDSARQTGDNQGQ